MLNLVGSLNFGNSTTSAVFVAGNYAYVANYQGIPNYPGALEIVDISDPSNPIAVGSYDQLSVGLDVTVSVSGSYAYIADQDQGLKIFDISNPSSPSLLGSYSTLSNSYSVAISAGYAYVVDADNHAVRVLDVANPADPTLVSSIITPSEAGPGSPDQLAISGHYLYVADFSPGIDIVDISDPTHPSIVTTFSNLRHSPPFNIGPGITVAPDAMAVSGQYLYVADQTTGLYILNISNPASPVLVGSYDPGAATNHANNYTGVQVEGNFAYVVDATGNLIELNVSNPTTPMLVGSVSTNGTAYGFNIVGNYAYIADGGTGLEIVDLGNQTSTLSPPTLSILPLDASKAEGNSGATPYTFTVVRSGDTSATATLDWSVTGGQGAAADASDFVGGSFPTGAVTFNPGDSIKTVTVNVQGDTIYEPNENFIVNLGNATPGAVIDPLHASANGQILNDDPAPPTLPDLTVSVRVAAGTNTLNPGDEVYVLLPLGNSSVGGGGPPFLALQSSIAGGAPSVDLGLYLSTDSVISTNDTLLTSFTISGLVGGLFGALLPNNLAPGQYYVGLVVDPFNKIAESNENNNASAGIAITVVAQNQSPVIDTAHSVVTGTVNKVANAPASTAPDTAQGTITFTDSDLATTTATVPAATVVFRDAQGLIESIPGYSTEALLAFQVGPVTSSSNVGSVGWTYSIPNSELSWLGANGTATVTASVQINDGQGGPTTPAVVTVTIHGANDPPVIDLANSVVSGTTSQATIGGTVEDVTQGTLAFSDPNVDDLPTGSVTGQSVVSHDSAGNVITLTQAQIAELESAFSIMPAPGNTNAGTIEWSYALPDQLASFLSAGESATITSTIQVDDHNGGTVTQGAAVTIGGSSAPMPGPTDPNQQMVSEAANDLQAVLSSLPGVDLVSSALSALEKLMNAGVDLPGLYADLTSHGVDQAFVNSLEKAITDAGATLTSGAQSILSIMIDVGVDYLADHGILSNSEKPLADSTAQSILNGLLASAPSPAAAADAMAFLSWAAYDRSNTDPAIGPLTIITAANNLSGSGWTALGASALGLPANEFQDGFFVNGNAAALIAVKDGTISIAFRGSDSLLDLANAIDFIPGLQDQAHYFDLLRPLISSVLSLIAQNPGQYSQLDVTGHSLGGIMAEWFAADYGSQIPAGVNVAIDTFGSPGVDFHPAQTQLIHSIVNFGLNGDPIFNDLEPGTTGGTLGRDGTNIVIDLTQITIPDPTIINTPAFLLNVTEHQSVFYQTALDQLNNSGWLSAVLSAPTPPTVTIDGDGQNWNFSDVIQGKVPSRSW
jgi:VCBS repeat-containing protein